MSGYFYAEQMRDWAVKHRADGDFVAASDLDVAADHMDRLAARFTRLKCVLDQLIIHDAAADERAALPNCRELVIARTVLRDD